MFLERQHSKEAERSAGRALTTDTYHMTNHTLDAMPVAVFGNLDGTTRVSLLDVLRQAYGDEVNNISSITISYRDKSWFDSFNPHFNFWTPGVPLPSRVLDKGDTIGALPNELTVDSARFKDISIEVGNNIRPNIYASVDWGTDASGQHHYQELTISTIPDELKTSAAFDGAPTPADVVAIARLVDSNFLGFPNKNDCDSIASAIAAAAGATLDPNTASLNPALNEEGGFWRIAYRGSDPNPVSDWQTLLKPGDIVRMGWADGGQHSFTVTQGLQLQGQHAGEIEVVDNRDNGTIGAHWADFDGNLSTPADPFSTSSPRLPLIWFAPPLPDSASAPYPPVKFSIDTSEATCCPEPSNKCTSPPPLASRATLMAAVESPKSAVSVP
jgi:hypothetical protein